MGYEYVYISLFYNEKCTKTMGRLNPLSLSLSLNSTTSLLQDINLYKKGVCVFSVYQKMNSTGHKKLESKRRDRLAVC